MRLASLLLVLCALLGGGVVFGQGVAPAIQWQNTIGGVVEEDLHSVIQTADGGYMLGGWSNSPMSGDKTEENEGGDCWVLKLDAAGAIQWQNTIGGTSTDGLSSIIQTTDGGYLIGATSLSDIGRDKTEYNQGGYDYWVVKLNVTGGIEWQNTIGGTNWDALLSVIQTADGGYLLGGYSESGIGGDKTEASQGGNDYWVVKLTATGAIHWQNTIGGPGEDYLYAIIQTADGGYLLGGTSESGIGGDKTEASEGLSDYWMVKLNVAGAIEWQNTIGGFGSDFLHTVIQTANGGYLIGGSSDSGISGDKTEASQGGNDFWVVKLEATGNIEWQNTIGGTGEDDLRSVIQTADGGYLLGGGSDSGISGDKNEPNKGGSDYWLVKLDTAAAIQWQSTLGGTTFDALRSVIQTTDGGFLLGGTSDSDISGDKTEDNVGYRDYWVVKLEGVTARPESTALALVLSVYPNPTSEMLNVAVGGNGPFQYEFIDATGRNIGNGTRHQPRFSLDVEALPAGMYLFYVTNAAGLGGVQRIVVLSEQ